MQEDASHSVRELSAGCRNLQGGMDGTLYGCLSSHVDISVKTKANSLGWDSNTPNTKVKEAVDQPVRATQAQTPSSCVVHKQVMSLTINTD